MSTSKQPSQQPEERSQESAQRGQPYDTTFKNWLKGQAEVILPLLLAGVVLLEQLTVEVIKPTMRADKVFSVLYRGEPHIFHIEFETGRDPYIRSRLLAYNGNLHHEYQLPVISMIIYPFRTTMASSPYIVYSGQQELNGLHFLTLALFEQDALFYVQEHLTCMYPLLPTMRGVTDEMMEQVMAELAALYQEDHVTLSDQFVAMRLLLDRSSTISESEKQNIRRRLMQYDPLWEESSLIQQERRESEARGELQASRRAVLTIVKTRFPSLIELAQQKVEELNKPDVLDYLLEEVVMAPDENVARWLLRPKAA